MGSLVGLTVTTKTASFTATTDDTIFDCDASAGAMTATLFSAALRALILIRKIDGSLNAVTIAAAAGETIGGLSSATLATNGSGRLLLGDGGTNWVVLATLT